MPGQGNRSADGRFRKGQSGNSKGRPRSAKAKQASSAFDIIFDRTLTVVQDGVPREMTVEEALQYRTYQDAVGGSRMAAKTILRMIAKREKAREGTRDGNWHPIVSLLEHVDPTNADAALQILGIATRDEDGADWENDRPWLLLETWAVEAAKRRRGGKSFDDRDLVEISRCTRDPSRSGRDEE